jgi:hypothetical protein
MMVNNTPPKKIHGPPPAMIHGPPPAMIHGPPPAKHHGFTLLEVLLAIGLSTVVLFILTTAIHQFLSRTDSSHGEVEINQLARALLNRMADDFRMARVAGFAAGSQEISTSAQDGSRSEQNNSRSELGELGLVGTSTEVRIDRIASWRWEPVPGADSTEANGSPADVTRHAQTIHPPETVRYFLREGDEVSAAELAKLGSQEIPVDSIAGLYFERWTTALSRTGSADSSATSESVTNQYSQVETTQLLAPEVIELEFAYADETGELVDQWDSAEQGALPRAVEIRLTLRREPLPGSREARVQSGRPGGTLHPSRGNTETYRLVIQLPDVQPTRAPTTNSRGNSMNSSRSTDSSGSTNSLDSGGESPSSSGSERNNDSSS